MENCFDYKTDEKLSPREIDFVDVDVFSKRQSYHDTLRDYQQNNKTKIYKAWERGKMSVMLQMPTGTGKTRLFASIIKDLQDYCYDRLAVKGLTGEQRQQFRLPKILVLVHRKELVEQIQETLTEKYKHACGVVTGTALFGEERNVIIASVQTLSRRRRLNSWEKKVDFDFIIIDEAHHSTADSYQRIRKSWPNARLLGVTATPYRLSHQPFTDSYDCLILSNPVFEFIEQGYLCNYEYYSIKPDSQMQYNIDHLKTNVFDGDYDERDMERLLNQDRIRANILKTYERFAKGKKGIVYTINRLHNQMLAELFEKHGYKVAYIDSETPKEERSDVVSKFREGKIDIIFNVNIFSEGFDCPDLEFIQLVRPTKSLSMYLQQVGRGFRISEGKDKVIFLDNVGLFNRFGLPSARRKWKYHFEGKEDWQEESTGGAGLLEEQHYTPRDLTEGNEDVMMVYSSIDGNESTDINEVESKEENKELNDNKNTTMDDNEIILNISGKQYPITGADKAAVLKSLLLVEERCTTGLIDVEGINVYLLKEQQKQAKIAALMKLLVEKGFSEEDVLQYLLENSRKEGEKKEKAELRNTNTVKTGISDISHKKQLETHLEENQAHPGLCIFTKDGNMIQEKNGRKTFLKAIIEAGVKNVYKLKIPSLNKYLVDVTPHDYYPDRMFIVDGYYITINHALSQMKKLSEEISDRLELGWKVVIIEK